MDVVDFGIYRYMFPQGEGRFWTSRSVIDPRVSPREIGTRIGLSEVAVRKRFAKLRAEGFIQGYDPWPNPRLFGASLRVTELVARSLADADRILLGLDRIDGVVSAQVMVDEDARHLRVSFIEDTPARTAERFRSIAALADPAAPPSSLPEWLPPCPPTLSPLDWRIVADILEGPDLSLSEHAQRVSLSLKTMVRRFNRLIDTNCIFWALKSDSSILSVAACFVRLRSPSVREQVVRAIESRVGAWLPIAPGGLGEPPNPQPPWIAAMFWVRAPAATEELTRVLLGVTGVESVQRRFPCKVVSYPNWFSRNVEQQLALARASSGPPWMASRREESLLQP